MASKKYYAYYLKGNKIAIVQKNYNLGHCSLAGYNNQTDCEAASGTWYSAGSSAGDSEDFGKYKSPLESIADGIELEYAYSPNFRINDSADVITTVSRYIGDGSGFIKIDGTTNLGSITPALAADSWILLENAGKFNGLHKVKSVATTNTTNDSLILYTRYSGSATAWVDFEETVNLYHNVSAMEDESFELDLNRYQANAIVYYIKAKMAEDAMNMEAKEYFMREFRKMIERFHTSREHGPKMIQPFGHFNLK